MIRPTGESIPGDDVCEPPLPSDRTKEVFPRNDELREPDDALRAVKMDRDLQVRDQQLALAAEAAGMGFWYCDYAREDFWASNEWRALFGFTSSETLYIDKFLQRLDPNDRELTLQALDNAYKGDGSYQAEHRLLMPDGQIRWIACQGRLELNSDRQPARLQGVSLDITRRKLAELEVHSTAPRGGSPAENGEPRRAVLGAGA